MRIGKAHNPRANEVDDFLGAETYHGDQALYVQTMSSIAADTANRIMRVADDGKLPFPDRHFDFVCSNEVFEHVHNLGIVHNLGVYACLVPIKDCRLAQSLI